MIMDTLNQKDIRTLINEGNFNEVVNKYKKIVEIEPNNYKAHNNLGNALKELGKFSQKFSVSDVRKFNFKLPRGMTTRDDLCNDCFDKLDTSRQRG